MIYIDRLYMLLQNSTTDLHEVSLNLDLFFVLCRVQ